MIERKKILRFYRGTVYSLAVIVVGMVLFIKCGNRNPENTGTITDIDGNLIRTVKIGNQWWTAENLRVKHYRNGEVIPEVSNRIEWSSLSTGACCIYEKEMPDSLYGRLYNWHAVNDSRIIAPEGWHVPKDSEWQRLIDFLGGDDDAGNRMKEARGDYWVLLNIGDSNARGFSALPGGYRASNGDFLGAEDFTLFWTASEHDTSSAWSRGLNNFNSSVNHHEDYKENGFSVRLVKDVN